jgi:glycosyltransferase involved in cell wall biosynthesis
VEREVRFLGRVSRPHLYLRAADLFLLTSRWEALPFSIVEAFQAGIPAVAAACSGVVELIDETVGAVVPIGDIEAIAAAAERILGDEALRRAMGKAALERSTLDRFDPDWVHRQFEATYRALAAR